MGLLAPFTVGDAGTERQQLLGCCFNGSKFNTIVEYYKGELLYCELLYCEP